MSAERSPTLEMKAVPPLQEPALGYQEQGGLIFVNGYPCLLRNHKIRFRQNGFGGQYAFFGRSDLEKVSFSLEGLSREITVEKARSDLEKLKSGERPTTNTLGLEFEGSLYDQDFKLVSAHDDVINPIADDSQPELNHFTLERATEKNNGFHLRGPVEISKALGNAVQKAYKIAESRQLYYVISSVPEGGNWEDGKVTDHPYLRSYAPFVLQHALDNRNAIPEETLQLYEDLGVDVIEYMESTGNLNWPMQGIHYHLGLPKHEGKTDMRVGLVNAHLRMTRMNKVVANTFGSTRHFYSQELDVKDVRSIAKRLLATTHDGSVPETEEEYLNKAINQLEIGRIPSISRFPQSGQHDRERIRQDTIESIGFSATPDLRTVVAGALFQEIQDVLAKEALIDANGDEQLAINILRERYGGILEYQPSLGENSEHEWDVRFNDKGKEDQEIIGDIKQTMMIIDEVGQRYPALKINALIVNKVIAESNKQVQECNLQARLGINEKGEYDPFIPTVGLVSEHKVGLDIEELIKIQDNATKKQAQALSEISSESDLLRFFGIRAIE